MSTAECWHCVADLQWCSTRYDRVVGYLLTPSESSVALASVRDAVSSEWPHLEEMNNEARRWRGRDSQSRC